MSYPNSSSRVGFEAALHWLAVVPSSTPRFEIEILARGDTPVEALAEARRLFPARELEGLYPILESQVNPLSGRRRRPAGD